MLGPVYMVSDTRDNSIPDGYHGRGILPLICLKNSINHLHEEGNTTREGELSRLGRWGNPRQQKLKLN